MAETIMINKKAIADLVKVKHEFDAVIESLELMGDAEFMNSFKAARGQIKKREFVDLDGI